jgi:murein DD-endopeptidase MepM/ murein hydrolase activator NlpD
LVLSVVAGATTAQATAPTPLAARLATALAQASAHGEAAARLRATLGTLADELQAVERELDAAATRQHVLEGAVHRTQALQELLSRELDAARARAIASAAVWRRIAASILSDRRAQESQVWLRRTGALLAVVQGELARTRADLEAAEEGWRQALQLLGWKRLTLHALPKRKAALLHRRAKLESERGELIAERTARLRRQEAARQLARRWHELDRTAQLAANAAWTMPPHLMVLPQVTGRGFKRLLLRAMDRSWTAVTMAESGAAALAPPVVLDGATLPGGRPALLPVGGQLAHAYGDRRAGPLWRGITVVVRHAGTVRAPRRGKVAFASPFGDFGPLLILDHGGGYHTLIAGMDRIDVTVGTEVGEGQAVGRLVASPGRPRRLYIELRHHGEPVDPLPWLASRLSAEAGSG